MNDRDRRPGLVWFRRDLRLDDNPAWAAATLAHDEVIALFVLEPELLDPASAVRRDQLLAHLGALDRRLRELGGHLTVRYGPAPEAVAKAVADGDAAAVHVNRDHSPFARERDRATEAAVGVPIQAHDGQTVHPAGSVLTRRGTLSQVFGPFHKTWRSTPLDPWPEPGPGRPIGLAGVELPAPTGPLWQEAGEEAARDRLDAWLDQVDDYPDTRDLPAVPGTSQLSADLKFGTLAARTVLAVVGTATAGRDAFVRQLAWRDWWAHLLAERPDLADAAVRPEYDAIAWRDDPDDFDRWCEGRTGFPIVDAGMRQLTTTGWMHNRVRMVCASFLVKDLLIDWRRGERFFRHHLVDADPAQNAGNWQWVAGTGPDAAPYFRIFNPTTQGEKFDPRGDYVRTWVPELAGLPAPGIHRPASLGPLDLVGAGIELGTDYPEPLVDHAEARVRTLAAYKAVVGS